jgi:hypothetical protein
MVRVLFLCAILVIVDIVGDFSSNRVPIIGFRQNLNLSLNPFLTSKCIEGPCLHHDNLFLSRCMITPFSICQGEVVPIRREHSCSLVNSPSVISF